MTVTVRLFAAAEAATGVGERSVPADRSIDDLLDDLAAGAPDPEHARRVLDRCSFVVDGLSGADRALVVRAGSRLDVMPPFAGG